VLTGARSDHWSGGRSPLDVYDAIGIAEIVGEAIGARIGVVPDDVAWLVRGRSARLVAGDDEATVGVAGELDPRLAAARGLSHPGAIVAGEIAVDRLAALAGARATAMQPLARHPSIVRDLAILVSDRLPAADVRGTIRAHAPATLVAIREFDRYQGTGVPDGQVSLALRLTFRDAERTLTDADVQRAVEAIVAALERAHGAVLRGGERQR
jgi:phenylalanyl-tRNA synthetase beta chain